MQPIPSQICSPSHLDRAGKAHLGLLARLCGLAPTNRARGQMRGKRHIVGARPSLRTAMTLFPFRDFFTQQNRQLENWDAAKVISFKLYTGYQQEVGSIRDLLVDEHGHFRYLVVDIKLEDIEKGILLPIGLAHLDYEKGEAIVHRLKPVLLKKLPSYQLGQTIDDRFEQRVRDVLLPIASCRMGRQFLQQPYIHNGQYQGVSSGYTPSSSRNYNHFPNFYGMSEEDNQRPLKQLENQLI